MAELSKEEALRLVKEQISVQEVSSVAKGMNDKDKQEKAKGQLAFLQKLREALEEAIGKGKKDGNTK